jgi:hypothetical protein
VDAWYEELRARYRPEQVRVLLIGESPPDPGSATRRFFYSPTLTRDNLYRGVATAIYGERPDFRIRDKPAVLEWLRRDGFWLIDAVPDPINQLTPSQRRRAIREGVPRLLERCLEIDPQCGVVICHSVVYKLVALPLRSAGVRILHDDAIPFPWGNHRARFVAEFRRALHCPRGA